MYVRPNFRTKKQLKEAVANGTEVTVFSPGPWPAPEQGVATIEGPHFPEQHRFYARVQVENGRVTKVIG